MQNDSLSFEMPLLYEKFFQCAGDEQVGVGYAPECALKPAVRMVK